MPVGASRSGAEHVQLSPPSANASGAARVSSTKLDQCALARIQKMVASAPIPFELWDGFELKSMAGPPVGTIRFKNRLALFGWVWDPDLNVGETYMSDTVEMRGDLISILEAIYRAVDPARPRAWWLWQPSNDARAAKHNVHHHYDIGRFIEAYVDCPLEVCITRDPKGIYRKAQAGHASTVPGMQTVYEQSEHPDVVVSGSGDARKAARTILRTLQRKGYISPQRASATR